MGLVSLLQDFTKTTAAWCEEQQKEPLALPTFGREFGELGVQKAKIAGRVRYIGIALRSGAEQEGDNEDTSPNCPGSLEAEILKKRTAAMRSFFVGPEAM